MTLLQEDAPPKQGPAPSLVGDELALQRARGRGSGRSYPVAYWAGGALLAAVVVAVIVTIATGSAQAFAHYGSASCLVDHLTHPDAGQYAAGISWSAPVVTTGLAIILAAPVGLGAAVALSELVPGRCGAAFLAGVIELLAAVPSIVVGLWASSCSCPSSGRESSPSYIPCPCWATAFGGPDYGPGILLASTVLAVMVLPTLVSLSRTGPVPCPVADREAALALGATRWQSVRKVLLPTARPGIGGRRHVGHRAGPGGGIAVAMVIGNQPGLPHSLLWPRRRRSARPSSTIRRGRTGPGHQFGHRPGGRAVRAHPGRQLAGQALRRAGRRPAPRRCAPADFARRRPVGDRAGPSASAPAGRSRYHRPQAAASAASSPWSSGAGPPGADLGPASEPAASPRACAPCASWWRGPSGRPGRSTPSTRAAPALSFGILFFTPACPVPSRRGHLHRHRRQRPGRGPGPGHGGPAGLLAALYLYERTGRLAGVAAVRAPTC